MLFKENVTFRPLRLGCYNIYGIWPQAKTDAMSGCSHFLDKNKAIKNCQKGLGVFSQGICSDFFGR